MTRTHLLAAAFASSLILCACQAREEAANEATVDVAAIAGTIRSQEAEWLQAWQARDINGVLARFAPDAVAKFHPAPTMAGGEAIRSGTAPFLADSNFRLQFSADQVRVSESGDLAYTRGHYSVTYSDQATQRPVNEAGTYLTIWHRQADGSWKVVEDMASADPPGAAPPATAAPAPTPAAEPAGNDAAPTG